MKKIQTKLIVVSLLIIAISLAVIAFKPIIEDIQYSTRRFFWPQRHRQFYEVDIVDQWLEKQK